MSLLVLIYFCAHPFAVSGIVSMTRCCRSRLQDHCDICLHVGRHREAVSVDLLQRDVVVCGSREPTRLHQCRVLEFRACTLLNTCTKDVYAELSSAVILTAVKLFYSALSAFAGFALAARNDRRPMVNHAKTKTARPAARNRRGLIADCTVKFCCHC